MRQSPATHTSWRLAAVLEFHIFVLLSASLTKFSAIPVTQSSVCRNYLLGCCGCMGKLARARVPKLRHTPRPRITL